MLEAVGLTKRFGGLVAVSDVTMSVREGAVVALIGPNGAGKTTLFACLSGFHRPDAGQVKFLGRTITGLPPHEICRLGLARTFQIVQPFGSLTVRENVAVGSQLRHRSRAAALRAAEGVAERVGLAEFLDRPAAALTVAGRKRLELARALATEPRLLLLDEVMAGLNPTEIAAILPTIRSIRDGGVTVLLIEHVMQAVMSLSEEVYVLNQGRLIAEGPPDALVRDTRVIEAYLGPGAARRLAAGA